MRILHLCLGNYFADNYSYQENMLPKYHAKQGHFVEVIASLFTFNAEGKGEYLTEACRYRDENGFDVVRLNYKRPLKWNRFFRHFEMLYEEIEKFVPDVIFSHNVSYGDTIVVKKYLNRNPKVLLFADNHADYINSARNWASRHILHPIIWRHYAKVIEPYMTKCFGVTPMRCRFLKEVYRIRPSIVEYLPLGVDDDSIPTNKEEVRNRIRNNLGVKEDDLLFFTGGKIGKMKNTHVLLEALSDLDNPRLHLVICGSLAADMEYLKEQIDACENYHYLGWCDGTQVIEYMVAADVACFPGTHSTLWEQSVGMGLPSIFKHWNEMDQVNINGNCVFVKGEDKEELKMAISRFLDQVYYQRMKFLSVTASKSYLYSEIANKAIGLS